MKKFIGFVVIVAVIAFAALIVLTKPYGAIEGIKNAQDNYVIAANTENGVQWEVKCYKRILGDRYVEQSLDDYVYDLPMIDTIEAAWEKAAEKWDDVVIRK